jgi:hypothetical protein
VRRAAGGHARRGVVAVVALAAIALAVGLAGCGGSSGASTPETGSGVPADGASATPASGGQKTAVYLLGGSSARECIETNASWSDAIEAAGGGRVRARDLGTSNQTFAKDGGIVAALPDGPTLVLIGVTTGRFTSEPEGFIDSPTPEGEAAVASTAEVEHRYKPAGRHRVSTKEEEAAEWVAERYPLFEQNFEDNLESLRQLIDLCRERGFTPAIVELPLNLDIAGEAFAPARQRYLDACRELDAQGVAPFVTFVDELAIPNDDFYDLFHLLKPGRAVWEPRLAEETARLIESGGASGT